MKMNYDFDTLIPRYKKGSGKWDEVENAGAPENIVPFSVADMEFKTAPEIVEGLKRYLDTTPLGYTHATDGYFEAVTNWMTKRHGFTPKREWFVEFPGVISALTVAVRAYTKPGDGVLICTPVYHHFRMATEENGRVSVCSELLLRDGKYEIDFDDFEKKAAREDVTMCIFCNPHNPVGRVWTKEEMTRVADICMRHHVFMVDDEIHADLIMPGYRQNSYLTLDSKYFANGMVCTAPNKTFNIAGLQTANIFVPDEGRRKQLVDALGRFAANASNLNALSYEATRVAYSECEEWLNQAIAYIDGNRAYVTDYLKEQFPEFFVSRLEGTYLLWVDLNSLGMTPDELKTFMRTKAYMFCDEGSIFGEGGNGFERINLACPRYVLVDAMERLAKAINDYRGK